MNICLYIFGSRGDAHPMIALGEVLAAEGHQVIVAAPPDFSRDALERGLPFQTFGSAAGALLNGGLGKLETTAEVIAQFEGVLAAAEGADLIVGAGVPLAGPSVAERTGARFRYVAYCPQAFFAPSQPPMLFPYQHLPRLANRVAWRAIEAGWYAWLDSSVNEGRKRIGLAPHRHNDYVGCGSGPDVLAADEALAPLPADLVEPVVRVPAIQLAPERSLSPSVQAFVGRSAPPVYVGFGSMPGADRVRLQTMVAEAAVATGQRFVVCCGDDAAEHPEFAPGCLAIGDEPHAELFPRCAAVVHHGGAGTTHTAARSGVPQVVAPLAADQFYWAERVRTLGVGVRGATMTKLTARLLAAAVEHASVDTPAAAARELAERITDRDGASALAALLTA